MDDFIPNIVLSHLMDLLQFFVALSVAFHILIKKQDPVLCLSWLLGVAMFPLATPIFYVCFGLNPFLQYSAKKRKSKEETQWSDEKLPKEEMLLQNRKRSLILNFLGFDRSAAWVSMLRSKPLSQGNQIEVLVNSDLAYKAIDEVITAARSYILVQFYQIQMDQLGTRFLDLLTKKANEGVSVYVLFDALGSHQIKNSHLKKYREQGLNIYRFLEIHPIKRRFQINWRNHRKLVVCDGEVAYTGGLNMGELYLQGSNKDRPKWMDMVFQLKGPIIKDLIQVFAEDWHFTTGRRLERSQFINDSEQDANHSGDNLMQIIASGPSEDEASFYSTLLNVLHESRQRVMIMTPYFVPDKTILHAMRMAVARGVKIQIMVPKKSNHPITDICAESYFDEISRFGIELLRYKYGVVHSKLLIADDDLVVTGSSNLDYRSFFLNFETDLFIRDRKLAGELIRVFEEMKEMCVHLTPKDITNKYLVRLAFRRVMRLFAPLM